MQKHTGYCHYFAVVFCVLSTYYKLELSEKREKQLRSFLLRQQLRQVHGVFLIKDWCQRAWTIMSGTTPRQVVPGPK